MAKHIQHRLTDLFLRKGIKEPQRYTGNMPFRVSIRPLHLSSGTTVRSRGFHPAETG